MTTGMRCADAEGRRSGTRTFRPYADASAAVLLLRPLCTALLRPSAFGSRSLRSGLPCSQCNQVRLRMRSGDGQRPCVCNAKVIQQSRRALFEADCRAKSHRFVSLFLRPSPETQSSAQLIKNAVQLGQKLHPAQRCAGAAPVSAVMLSIWLLNSC